jgi:2-amino-4-hydroxy-6-hydroxymethyldihydropteridine diphosphokinase
MPPTEPNPKRQCPDQKAFIALGSNLDNPIQQCQKALQYLGQIKQTKILQVSSYYETEALKTSSQNDIPDFINAVVLVKTGLTPQDLLIELLGIEQTMGRLRSQRWDPRLIDLDLIAYESLIIETPRLSLPHPGIPHRLFVLKPLAEISPNWQHPITGESVWTLINKAPSLRIQQIPIQRLPS